MIDDVLGQAEAWLADGHKVALGTVVKTWGSAPRQAGSQIAIRDDGAFVGSVSGGCVEGAVIESAQDAIRTGQIARKLEFGVSDEEAWAVGLACGGQIEIFVEPVIDRMKRRRFRRSEPRAQGRPRRSCARSISIRPKSDCSSRTPIIRRWVWRPRAARADRSAPVEIEGSNWFLSVHNPPLDLAIIGAVHIAQPLAPMAALADYRVRIIDPRTAFATQARFPGVSLSHDWADEALAKQPLGPRSALIALTHDPKLDDPALAAALALELLLYRRAGIEENACGTACAVEGTRVFR